MVTPIHIDESNQLEEGTILPSIALGLGLLVNIQASPAQKTKLVNYNKPLTTILNVNLNIQEQRKIDTIAKTIYSEAAGEQFRGKLAVASVIWNRVYGDNASAIWKRLGLDGVCKQDKQFSGWNNGEIKITLRNPKDAEAWEESVNIAKTMVNNTFKPIISSTHYYNPNKASPSWGRKLTNVIIIGRHKFGEI